MNNEMTQAENLVIVIYVIYFAVLAVIGVITIVGQWASFSKAGLHGWGAIIPVYNIYLLVKLAGRPGWWVILFFVPVANTAVAILVALGAARAFGKSTEFGVIGLYMFPFVGYLMTGFGSAKYVGQQQS